MDWKKLDQNLKAFAAQHEISLEESKTAFPGGQVTVFRLNEHSKVFYELNHTKPIIEFGSRLRVYSKLDFPLSIKVKTRLIGKPSLKSNIDLSEGLKVSLIKLAREIGSYKWTSQPHHTGWPTALHQAEVLSFECKQIELAITQLVTIRAIHLELLQINPGR